MPLTELVVRNAKPQQKPYRLFDSHGLYVEVTPSGSRLWRLKYRYAGKEKRLSFGVHPEVTLKEARDRRDDARKALRDGPAAVDPAAPGAGLAMVDGPRRYAVVPDLKTVPAVRSGRLGRRHCAPAAGTAGAAISLRRSA